MERLKGAIFAPLAPAVARLPAGRFPTHAELTALAEGISTSRGRPLRFVAPREHTDRERRYYELHIADSGADYYIVASGEVDLACRITHIPKAAFA